jgi:hypothetical protein
MNVMAAARVAPPLHDLLGASFQFNSTVTALAWDGGIACFGLGDGAVAMLPCRWDGAPRLEPRAGGGSVIVAGEKPPPPPAIVPAHAGGVLALARDKLGGVLSGGADGKALRIADGKPEMFGDKPRRRVEAVAAGRGGRRAFAAGRQVDRSGPDAGRLNLPGAVTALAFDPSGLHLAVGYVGGVSLEACGIRRAPRWEAAGAFTLLAWRHDGGMIAAASGAPVALRDRDDVDWQVINDLPGPAQTIGFTALGALVIAGADFARLWRDGEASGLGMAVAPVACHPRLNLVACAARDGGIFICQPGTPGALAVREAGAAPTHLAFAPDGEALAFAAADGELGTVMLPDTLFRFGEIK